MLPNGNMNNWLGDGKCTRGDVDAPKAPESHTKFETQLVLIGTDRLCKAIRKQTFYCQKEHENERRAINFQGCSWSVGKEADFTIFAWLCKNARAFPRRLHWLATHLLATCLGNLSLSCSCPRSLVRSDPDTGQKWTWHRTHEYVTHSSILNIYKIKGKIIYFLENARLVILETLHIFASTPVSNAANAPREAAGPWEPGLLPLCWSLSLKKTWYFMKKLGLLHFQSFQRFEAFWSTVSTVHRFGRDCQEALT